MYNFRSDAINPETGLTWQEEYEASLQEENEGFDWSGIGSILTGVGSTLYGLTTPDAPKVEEEEKTILGMKPALFYTLVSVVAIAGAFLLYKKLR